MTVDPSHALEVRVIPCLQDNHGFLVHEPVSGETATIDTPDPDTLQAAAAAEGWRITQIWNTHHHWDHGGGNPALKAATGARVTGPAAEADKIPVLDQLVSDGDEVSLGGVQARVMAAPGHTLGHVLYVFDDQKLAFVGDTLFAMGCGRLFEGTPAQIWASLSRVAALPPDTVIYCAHEYTQANARFALSVDPHNPALQARAAQVDALRAEGRPTVPTTLAQELATNPFLRAREPDFAAGLGLAGAPAVEVFAEARRRKDVF
ncbi:MAG: hydroxyacylglutathione hydrolase [Maricaulaceae bacterium]